MSFLFGGSKSGGSSSSTNSETMHQTSTPNVPAWLQTQTQTQSQNIAKLAGQDPYGLVPGANPLQKQAGAIAGTMTGQPWNFEGAMDVTRGVSGQKAPTVQAASGLTNLSSWQNPFEKSVIDTSAADFDHNAAMQHAQRTLDAANSGAFGGSGAAIAQTMGDDASNRARATLLSGLRSHGFDTAAANSQQDATRAQDASSLNAQLKQTQDQIRLAAANQIGQLSTNYDANQRANLSAMFDTGSGLRGIDQQQLTAPLDLQAWANAQFGTLPANLFVGQTTDGTSNGTSTGKQSGYSFKGGVSGPVPF